MRSLREHREARGWSRAELARRAVLNATTVGWVETGRFRPYSAQVKKLARALGLKPEELERSISRDGDAASREPARADRPIADN